MGGPDQQQQGPGPFAAAIRDSPMHDILLSIILGVVEGITEFLPISSTAHLLVTERLLGLECAGSRTRFRDHLREGQQLTSLA